MILTIPIFGVALFIYDQGQWGRWTAITLMVLWVTLAAASAAAEAKREPPAPARPPLPRWASLVNLVLFLAVMAIWAGFLWLKLTGASDAVLDAWRDGCGLAAFLYLGLTAILDRIASRMQSLP